VAESSGAIIRFYRPGDEESLLVLLQTTFGGWPKLEIAVPAIDHLRWKLSSDPSPERYQVLAEAGGRIVGCRLFFLYEVRVRGRSYFIRSGFDLAIHPDYRGRGILNEMWAFARKHLDDQNDFNFGVGDHPAALHMRASQGNIDIANRIHVLVHDGVPVDPGPDAEEFDTVDVRAFDERTDAFFDAASAQFDFLVARTSRHLNWRYCDPRAGLYRATIAQSDDELLGYIVTRLSHGRGFVADVLALPGRLDVVERLVRQAVLRLRSTGVAEIDCWMAAHHPYRRLLEDAGFRRKRTVPLSYRHLRLPANELEFLQDSRARVHITAGDTDLV
jgi:ribosomal protein S18 acetylase RimI-like enzyme